MKFHYSSYPNGMKLSAVVCLVSLPSLPRQINQIVSLRVKLRGASIRQVGVCLRFLRVGDLNLE